MTLIDVRRTMSEVVGEMGIRDANCEGLSPADFVTELAKSNGREQNHAKKICEGCLPKDKCPINLGTVSLSSILLSEPTRS